MIMPTPILSSLTYFLPRRLNPSSNLPKLLHRNPNRLQRLRMRLPPRRNNPLIRFQCAPLRKVKGFAVHVGAETAGFGDEEGAGGVILRVVKP